jgi:hypothetical protein
LAHRTREEAKYILKTHNLDPSPPEVLSALRSIVAAAKAKKCVARWRRRSRKS